MSEDEKNVRAIIEKVIQMNISLVEAGNIFGRDFKLADKECISIAKNYPFAWQDIRATFAKSNK